MITSSFRMSSHRTHTGFWSIFSFVTFCLVTTAWGQPPITSFVPSNNSDIVVAGGVTDIHMVNCDMLDVGAYFGNGTGVDKLWAIAYGNEKGSLASPLTSGLYVGVETSTGSYTPMGIPLPYTGLPNGPTEAFDPASL
ncbi:MAG: hypothetical protein K8F30_15380 [Taibaiella sp.]|nr:hypothetical protein [Taibaiella sp.]